MFTPAPLKYNCGYARTAIRELTPKCKRPGQFARQVDKEKRACEFQEIFGDIGFPEKLFAKGNDQFNAGCENILNSFSKRWKRMARVEYEEQFSLKKWKALPIEEKKNHSISKCIECSKKYSHFQQAFPGKPIFKAEQVVSLNLSKNPHSEKAEVRTVIKDLNSQWQDRHGHSYTSAPKNRLGSKPSNKKN